jgi:hypothetical protein
MVIALDAFGQRLDGGGLGKSGHTLHQQVTFTHQANQHAVNQGALPDDPGCEVIANPVKGGWVNAAILALAASIQQCAGLLNDSHALLFASATYNRLIDGQLLN